MQYMIIKCIKCKKEFISYPCEKNRRFCSNECRKNGSVRQCLQCKKQFYCFGYRLNTQKWCSVRCKSLYSRKDVECDNCKKIFNRLKIYIKDKNYCSIKCKAKSTSGSLNFNWKGGVSKENAKQRSTFFQTMQKQVLKRDNYTCQLCGSIKNLQVDHIQSWSEYIELRFCIDNCRTLCARCHYFITYNKEMPKNAEAWGNNYKQRNI